MKIVLGPFERFFARNRQYFKDLKFKRRICQKRKKERRGFGPLFLVAIKARRTKIEPTIEESSVESARCFAYEEIVLNGENVQLEKVEQEELQGG